MEPRFASYNEVKEDKGKRDRAQQEIFLHENKVALEDLPLERLNQKWLPEISFAFAKKEIRRQIKID